VSESGPDKHGNAAEDTSKEESHGKKR
jgi:hypothetical protein